MEFHLAQVNVAKLRAPVDSPASNGFMANIEPINALADASPGFTLKAPLPEPSAVDAG